MINQVNTLGAQLNKLYSTGKVCNKPGERPDRCYPLDPGIQTKTIMY